MKFYWRMFLRKTLKISIHLIGMTINKAVIL